MIRPIPWWPDTEPQALDFWLYGILSGERLASGDPIGGGNSIVLRAVRFWKAAPKTGRPGGTLIGLMSAVSQRAVEY